MGRIILLEKIHASAIAHLRLQGFDDILQIPVALQGDELLHVLGDADAVGIRSGTQLHAAVVRALPRLRVIGCFCIGTNQVDRAAAAARGIPVFNAPFSNTRSVAELVIAEAILLLRRIPEKNANAHRGMWHKSAEGAFEVRGKLLGIIGYGNIGAQVGVLAESVGMRVVYYDVENKLPLGNAHFLSLETLLAEADVVTLHVPGGAGTKHMIDAKRLSHIKESAVLINASRGDVVDIAALDRVLREKRIAGAALDVFPQEPRDEREEFMSPLRGLDNVILTPHIGGSTMEAQENIGREVADKIARFLTHGTTRSAVNFPEIAFSEKVGRSRILHVHRNAPGVIARLNASLAQAGLNIVAQHLETRGEIGYVITDVDNPIVPELLRSLCGDPAVLRCDLV